MKILVYGAGTLGSLCAARMAEAGKDVTVLARGKRLEFLRKNGIVLEYAFKGEQKTVPVKLIERLAPDDAYDLVIAIMAKYQALTLLPSLAANRCTPNILFMGNSVSGGAEYIQALGKERVLSGFYMAGGSLKDGVVWYADDTGKGRRSSPIGELDGSITPRLQEIASTFESSGIPVEIHPNIDAYLKTHAAIILPLAGAVYLAGGDPALLAENDPALECLLGAWKETIRVLKARRIPLLPGIVRVYAWLPGWILKPVLRTSLRKPMAQVSFAHGEKAHAEMGQLAEEFVALSHGTGIEMPLLEALFKVS